MPGTLSESPQKDKFIEYLTVVNKSQKAPSFIASIDSLCLEIVRQNYMGASKDNALDVLNKRAIESHSKEDFLYNISHKPFNNHYRSNMEEAYLEFFKFVDTHSTAESFASYMVGRYRLGYEYLARYWAAILFEQIIVNKAILQDPAYWHKLKKKPERKGREPSLDEIIDKLLSGETLMRDSIYKNEDVFTRYHDSNFNVFEMSSKESIKRLEHTRERLLNFKLLRNDIAHAKLKERKSNNDLEMPNNNLELIYYVWSELLSDSFYEYKKISSNFNKQKSNGREDITIIKAISELNADYMVRAIDETTKENAEVFEFQNIKSRYFEDMFVMREQLLSLKDKLTEMKFISNAGLTTDIVTTIDTTSAYIWMPLVPYRSIVARQQGIYNCAVSILVTPLDFRVYIDFGGRACKERKVYYHFLGSSEYRSFIESFEGKEEMEVFDIDWFCFIAERTKLGFQGDILNSGRIKLALQKLDDSTPPITWNRMLHGYILKRENIPDGGISLDWIKTRLGWIIQFYQAFNKFCSNN